MMRWLFHRLVAVVLMALTSAVISFGQKNPFSSPLTPPLPAFPLENAPNALAAPVVPSLQGVVEVEGHAHALFLLQGKKYFVTQGGLIGPFVVFSIDFSKVILKNQKTSELIPLIIQ